MVIGLTLSCHIFINFPYSPNYCLAFICHFLEHAVSCCLDPVDIMFDFSLYPCFDLSHS